MNNRELHQLEYTKVLPSGNAVFHYTCNSPNQEVLNKYGIEAIGVDLNCNPREVLIIPIAVFEKEGIPIPRDEDALKIRAENLIRRLK